MSLSIMLCSAAPVFNDAESFKQVAYGIQYRHAIMTNNMCLCNVNISAFNEFD